MRKHFLICFITVCLLFPVLSQGKVKPTKGLFPRQDYISQVSKAFFKKVSLTQPLISKVAFFIRTETYLSAYIELAVFVSKNEYFTNLFPSIEKDFPTLINELRNTKKEIEPTNYTDFQTRIQATDAGLFKVSLYVLANDYQGNYLSGEDAFRLWNIILSLIEKAYKDKKGDRIENAEILNISSHLIFFKDYKKWEKQSAKLIKKNTKELQKKEK